MPPGIALSLAGTTGGRALLVDGNGRLYVSRRYAIYRSDDLGRTFSLDCEVPAPAWRRRPASPAATATTSTGT